MSNSNCFYAQNSEEKNLTLIYPQVVMETLRLKTLLSTNSQEKTVYSKKERKKPSGTLPFNGQVEEDGPRNDSGNSEGTEVGMKPRDRDVMEPLEETGHSQ